MADPPGNLDDDLDEGRQPQGGGRRLVVAVAAGVLVVGVLTLLIVGLVNRDVGTRIDDALAAGERPEAPEFSLPLLTDDADLGPAGTEVSLSDLRGRVVVLNFWASWCVPCKDEAPILESVWDDYADRGVVVLGVDTQDLSGEAIEFLSETDTTYPSVRDGTTATETAYETTGVPETFVIDEQGRIALRFRGPLSEEAQVTTALDQLL